MENSISDNRWIGKWILQVNTIYVCTFMFDLLKIETRLTPHNIPLGTGFRQSSNCAGTNIYSKAFFCKENNK